MLTPLLPAPALDAALADPVSHVRGAVRAAEKNLVSGAWWPTSEARAAAQRLVVMMREDPAA